MVQESKTKGVRVKPLAASMALVFAMGISAFSAQAEAASGNTMRAYLESKGYQIERPKRDSATQARIDSLRHNLKAARLAGNAVAVSALQSEIKALRATLRPTEEKSKKAGLAALRADASRLADMRTALRSSFKQKQTARLERAKAKHANRGYVPNGSPVNLMVTNCDDSGAGSLRDAVANAVNGDTVDLSDLTCSTITLTTGSIFVTQDNLTIQGPGADSLTIDANEQSTVIDFSGLGTLTINDATLTNGYYFDYAGGAVWGYQGNIALNNSVISNSRVETYEEVAIGAALVTAGNISLTNSVVTNTSAYSEMGGAGGAVASKYGTVTMVDSIVTSNSVTGYDLAVGGGVYSYFAPSITGSTLSGNDVDAFKYGGFGGGLYTADDTSPTIIVSSTVSGNSATAGGGVTVEGLEMTNATISGNSSVYNGGGVYAFENISILNSTIVENTAGYYGAGILMDGDFSIDLHSSIVYGNTDSLGASDVNGYFDAGSANNLIGSSLNEVPADTLSADPLLGPLADNGGLTHTHALLEGSPAIDAGSNTVGLDFDQRGDGYAREANDAADIGAFEVQPADVEPIVVPEFKLVPATTTWGLGLLGMLMGFFGWRRGWFENVSRNSK